MDRTEVLRRATHEFDKRLTRIGPGDWDRPTPCDEWTVFDLVDHVVAHNLRYVAIISGTPAELVRPRYDERVLGPDPIREYRSGCDSLAAAFAEPGALEATVTHPRSGTMPGRQLFVLHVNELAIHAWDLARTIGSEETLHPDVVTWLYELLAPFRAAFAASDLYKALAIPDSETSAQTRLLHLMGRTP